MTHSVEQAPGRVSVELPGDLLARLRALRARGIVQAEVARRGIEREVAEVEAMLAAQGGTPSSSKRRPRGRPSG